MAPSAAAPLAVAPGSSPAGVTGVAYVGTIDGGVAAVTATTGSPIWDRDWGGLLQFFDAEDNIEAAFKPSFNTLNIFTVPQHHSVSMVATYVQAQRLAVTGWFRSDEPPGPITTPA